MERWSLCHGCRIQTWYSFNASDTCCLQSFGNCIWFRSAQYGCCKSGILEFRERSVTLVGLQIHTKNLNTRPIFRLRTHQCRLANWLFLWNIKHRNLSNDPEYIALLWDHVSITQSAVYKYGRHLSLEQKSTLPASKSKLPSSGPAIPASRSILSVRTTSSKMPTCGQYFRVTTYGESHCRSVGCIVDGCPSRQERENI